MFLRVSVIIGLAAMLVAPMALAQGYVELEGPNGFEWEIDTSGSDDPIDHGEAGSGAIENGTSDATDYWPLLCIRAGAGEMEAVCSLDDIYNAGDVDPEVALDGRLFILGTEVLAGLTVHRQVYVPDSGDIDFVRYVEVLENATDEDITVSLRYGTAVPGEGSHENDLGSDSDTHVTASSDGDLEIDPTDTFVCTDDDEDGDGDPSLGHVLQGVQRLMTSAGGAIDNLGDDDESDVGWDFNDVVVPAGTTVGFIFFFIQAEDDEAAAEGAAMLDDMYEWPEEAWLGLPDGITFLNFADDFIVLDDPLEFGVNSGGSLIVRDESVGLRLTDLNDFVTPGSPWEMWAVETVQSGLLLNNYDDEFMFPMGLVVYDPEGPEYELEQEGMVDTLGVNQSLAYDSGDNFIEIESTISAMGGALTDVRFMRAVDPDQDADNTEEGDNDTDNDVLLVEEGALVIAEGEVATMALASMEPTAVASVEEWEEDPDETLDTPNDPDGERADDTIHVAFDLGPLADGESASVVYYYIVTPTLDETLEVADELGLRIEDFTDRDDDGSTWPTDCDDDDEDRTPGADEVCDGVDNDCDGVIPRDEDDWDDDGYRGCEECDDTDADISPDADEICDGIDNDCDDEVDEGVTTTYYLDDDRDGQGDPDSTIEACSRPARYVANSDDCDDSDRDIYLGAPELCDGIDNDCDDEVDEDVVEVTFYMDADGDGYGDDDETTEACAMPDGYVSRGGDCDDSDATVYPPAPELCDGIDNNCNDVVDEGVTTTYWEDFDEDGYGDPEVPMEACEMPDGYVDNSDDCDDVDEDTFPDADELCDMVDNDCDGEVDEGVGDTYYFDNDDDGFGDEDITRVACEEPDGYVDNSDDCDDTDDLSYPDADELCDGADNDCDGEVDEGATDPRTWYEDSDDDGIGDEDSTEEGCEQPDGYVRNDGDNCPDDANADQADADEDGIGDACDDDTDGDGVNDDTDNCPDDANEDQIDLDEDGIGDICDDDVVIDGGVSGGSCDCSAAGTGKSFTTARFFRLLLSWL